MNINSLWKVGLCVIYVGSVVAIGAGFTAAIKITAKERRADDRRVLKRRIEMDLEFIDSIGNIIGYERLSNDKVNYLAQVRTWKENNYEGIEDLEDITEKLHAIFLTLCDKPL